MKTYTEDEILAAIDDYETLHHDLLEERADRSTVVIRNYYGNTDAVIGFTLSISANGNSLGVDERFGA